VLKYIYLVTIVVSQLSNVEPAWEEHLAYSTVHRGEITGQMADLWNAPAMTGRPFIIMQPESQAPVYVRFIEAEVDPGYAPMMTWGWNATELLVEDPDELAARLAGSPFRIIGPPADLYEGADAPRAMQALGPGDELLYFTRIIPSGTELALSGATTPVDRVFITVVGGPSLAALGDFYARLGLPIADLGQWRIDVLAQAHGMPADSRFPLAVARFPRDYLIELDEYPASAGPRPLRGGELPPGLALVSVMADDLGQLEVEWRSPPRAIAEFPYSGRRAGTAVGPAGEWLEVIELTLR
jgi:hypothetical protein